MFVFLLQSRHDVTTDQRPHAVAGGSGAIDLGTSPCVHMSQGLGADRVEKVLFLLHVIVKRGFLHTQLPGELPDRRARVPSTPEQLGRGRKQPGGNRFRSSAPTSDRTGWFSYTISHLKSLPHGRPRSGWPTFDRAGATADLQMIDGDVTSIKRVSVIGILGLSAGRYQRGDDRRPGPPTPSPGALSPVGAPAEGRTGTAATRHPLEDRQPRPISTAGRRPGGRDRPLDQPPESPWSAAHWRPHRCSRPRASSTLKEFWA